jgi:hypothetical protein
MKQVLAIGLLWLLLADYTAAHDPGLSSLTFQNSAEGLTATLVLSVADAEGIAAIDANHDGRVSEAEFGAARPRLEEALLDACELKSGTEVLPAISIATEFDLADGIQVRWLFPAAGGEVTLRSGMLELLPRGHRQFATVVDGSGRTLQSRLLDVKNASLGFTLPQSIDSAPTAPSAVGAGRRGPLAGRWFGLAMLAGLVAIAALKIRRRERSA